MKDISFEVKRDRANKLLKVSDIEQYIKFVRDWIYYSNLSDEQRNKYAERLEQLHRDLLSSTEAKR